MNTFKIKTAELTGAALDWAVAQVVGVKVITDPNSPRQRQMVEDAEAVNGWYCYSPSTDWSQGGPLIEKYHITFSSIWNGWHSRLFATIGFRRTISGENANGAGGKEFNYLLAACRAVVVAEMGDEVEVPQELISSQG